MFPNSVPQALVNKDMLTLINNNICLYSRYNQLRLFKQFYNITSKNSGRYAELLFNDYLKLMNTPYKEQVKIHDKDMDCNFKFDIVAYDNNTKKTTAYEIKCLLYDDNNKGTITEKIYGIAYKYGNIKSLNIDKLIVVCMLQATDENDNKLFYDCVNTRRYLQYCNSIGIEFVRFQDMLANINDVYTPFYWVGNKTKLLNNITPIIDNNLKQTYYEPFLGSGAVLISLMNKYGKQLSYNISDINIMLINCWNCIKNYCYELISKLTQYENTYNNQMVEQNEEDYNVYKHELNEYINMFSNTLLDNIELEHIVNASALFMIVNKTCYGGVYRVNDKNEFNTPFGKRDCVKFDYVNIAKLCIKLNMLNVNIQCSSYIDNISIHDSLIYMDPPYTNTYQRYTTNKINDVELTQYINECKTNNNIIILSNSSDYFDINFKEVPKTKITYKYNIGKSTDEHIEYIAIIR